VGENTGLKEIKHLVATVRRTQSPSAASVQTMDLWDAYKKHVLSFLKLGRPLKVAVDASNGMAGKMVPAVFGDCGIEFIKLNFEIGKGFAHPPNPLIESYLSEVRKAVVESQADFGICFDGDADRCMFIDERGEPIRADFIEALLARHFLGLHPGSTIIYDLRSSRVVAEEIRLAGGLPRRERVGHAFIKKTMSDTHAVFGGELSGHFYFRDNYNADSGAIVFAVAASVISARKTPLSELIAPLKRYVQSGEMNFQVMDKAGMIKELQARYKDAQIDQRDGVTIEYKDWWFNVRPSNTEPLLRLNLEAKDKQLLDEKLHEVKSILGEPIDE
jgi:phosphomannomutase